MEAQMEAQMVMQISSFLKNCDKNFKLKVELALDSVQTLELELEAEVSF